MSTSLTEALVDSVPALLTAVVTILLGAAAGGRITARWELIKKRREIDLAAADAFYTLYGEFYGIWNEWDAARNGAFPQVDREGQRWALFGRAAAAQARVEALVAKLAIERVLSEDERALLGCFRQAYRTVGKSLEGDRPVGVRLTWRPDGSVDPSDFDVWSSSEAVSYQTFKELATAVGALVSATGRAPDKVHASRSLRVIADNAFERPRWVGEARHRLGLATAQDPRLALRAWIYLPAPGPGAG